MSPPQVLRVNQLRRRAAKLGTDIEHLIRFDAATRKPEPPSGDGYAEDAERADKNHSAVPERTVP